jgi:hypothetical protein
VGRYSPSCRHLVVWVGLFPTYTTSCPTYEDYEEMFQSVDVEDPTSFPVYDVDDEGGSSMLAPNYDVDSTPHPIYDMYDDAGMIVPEYDNEGVDLVDENRSEILYEEDSPRESHHCTISSSESVDNPHHVDEITSRGLEDRLLVTEEQIVQVLMREDGAHKFIEDLMWKTQLEERQKGVTGGVTSTQLHIIKEALEQMKSDYLQLFMDRDLALKFIEDKEREVEELCYQLSLACSSSLTTETPSSLAAMTHEGVSGTHDLREEPFVMIPHEEHSELQVLEERYDTEGFDHALVLHCGDHEPLMLESPLKAQGLATKEIVEHIPCGPGRKEVYASMDWVDMYMTDMGMLWDTGSSDLSRVMDTIAPTGYRMVHDDSVMGNNMQGYSLAHDSVQWSLGVSARETSRQSP